MSFPGKTALRVIMMVVCALSLSSLLRAEVISIELFERRAFAEGASFGETGSYEILRGVVRYHVDPTHPRNRMIVDLSLAPRNVSGKNASGKVEFAADLFVLAPKDLSKGNRAIFYDVNNRGGKLALSVFNSARSSNRPSTREHAGNGFLFRRGYTVVWCGWDAEILPGNGRLLLGPPVATEGGGPIRGRVRQEIVADGPAETMPLSRRANHGSYRPAPGWEKTATLTWRLRETDRRVAIPRGQWSLEKAERVEAEQGVSATLPEIRLRIAGGFRPGSIYELIYLAEGPMVQGLGFAAVRDLISFMKYEPSERNPFRHAGEPILERAHGFGVSQSGRFLRHLLFLGCNVDEEGRKVFDGLIPHVAGAGLGFFNHRFAQPNRHNGQHEDHLFTADRFPFTYGASHNPFTGETDAIQARTSLEDPALLPKVMHTQSAAEYWHRAGSLVHTDPLGRRDAPIPPNVRIYTFGGTQHGPAGWPPGRGLAQNLTNPADYKPILRALLDALDAWTRDGTPPPASVYPRIADRSLVPWDQESTGFPQLPGVRYPQVIQQPHELDHGPHYRSRGIITVLPPRKLADFTVLVPRCDADGNNMNMATLLPAEVAVPLATYTGWNLRRRDVGAEDMLASLAGSFLPFPKTREGRKAAGDPRKSIEERYEGLDDYRRKFSEACENLVERRYMLREDAQRLANALEKYANLFPDSWKSPQ